VVDLASVTRENVLSACALEVKAGQQAFVSANAVSLAEAYVRPEARPFVITSDGAAIGFVMLYVDDSVPVVALWRLMIDAQHQGRGYGAAAVERVIDHVRRLRLVDELLVGALPGERGPTRFYERLGFEPTGAVGDDGEVQYRFAL
jgi:diamine N-acetyltransferase